MSVRVAIAILLAIAVSAGAVLFVWRAGDTAAPSVTFVSLKGERIPMKALRGRVILVEFWATDCATCVKEMPQLVDSYQRFRSQGFETIAVAMRYDPPNYVIAYTESNRLPFPVALDPMGDLARAFGNVKFTPTTFLIDRRGKLVARIVGVRDFTRLAALIEEKLREPA